MASPVAALISSWIAQRRKPFRRRKPTAIIFAMGSSIGHKPVGKVDTKL
jgi:hypothetical protein